MKPDGTLAQFICHSFFNLIRMAYQLHPLMCVIESTFHQLLLAPMLGTIVLIILILLILGALPVYPHSRDWGYYPSGGLGLVVVVILVLLLMKVI